MHQLLSAHFGTEAATCEREDEKPLRRAPRFANTRFNDALWKHFRPTMPARVNASHVAARSKSGFLLKEQTWTAREERINLGAAARPPNRAEIYGEDAYAKTPAEVERLANLAACARRSKLCGSYGTLAAPARAMVVGVRHPGAWLDSVQRHCPDCPFAIRGTRSKATWHAPAYYVALWADAYGSAARNSSYESEDDPSLSLSL